MKEITAPAVRFKGFTDPWGQCKLGEMVNFSKGTGYSKSDLKESGTPIILYGRLYTKYETIISGVDTFADEKPNSVFSEGGEVIVPASGETAEDISVASVVDQSGVLLGGDLNIVKPPSTLDSTFLAISISNGKPHRDMANMAQGKSVVHLHNSDLAKIDLPYPRYEEQCRISQYFKSIDHIITLHQYKLDQQKKLKKYFLQNMFPAKGEKVPRIRFKGFTGDWEERKLGECAPIRGGCAFESKKFVNSGVPIIRISNILGDGNVGGEFTYYDEQNNDSQYILPDKALIMAMSGATTGKVGILDNPNNLKYYQNQRVGYFLQNDEYDYKFIGTFLRSNLFQNQLKEVLVSGAQPNISGNDINKLIINIPVSLAEQKQIGRIMELFDEIIAIHHRRLDQLQTMKKYMLQNLFI